MGSLAKPRLAVCDPGPTGPLVKHNKMLEYLNFCLLCALFALIFYLYIRIKKYSPLLEMAEEIFSGYDAQSDTKHQKLFECVLTRNSKLYLGKADTEDQLAKLKKKWKNVSIITKLSSQARWCVR